jgi:hypothetical protein
MFQGLYKKLAPQRYIDLYIIYSVGSELETNILALRRIEPRFLFRAARSQVSVPTELSQIILKSCEVLRL